MPCLGPLTLRQHLRLIRSLAAANARATLADTRVRRLGKWTGAAMAGLLLIQPSALHHDPMGSPETMPVVAAVMPLPAHDDGTADLGTDDFMLSAGKLPATFPEGWRKPPCPKAKSITKERGACFLILAETPPCGIGYDDSKNRCLYPIAERKGAPNTIGR